MAAATARAEPGQERADRAGERVGEVGQAGIVRLGNEQSVAVDDRVDVEKGDGFVGLDDPGRGNSPRTILQKMQCGSCGFTGLQSTLSSTSHASSECDRQTRPHEIQGARHRIPQPCSRRGRRAARNSRHLRRRPAWSVP